MAYREHGMWEVLDVLRRAHRGEGVKRIVRATGRSRNTVRRYLRVARSLGWNAEGPTADERLAARVLARCRPGPPDASPGRTEARLAKHRDTLESWLRPESEDGSGLTLTKCQERLRQQGVDVPYSSLHRFAVQRCAFGARQGTVRMPEVAPGELAEVDFGRLGLIPAEAIGTGRRVVHALVVTLVHSRHQYVHLTHSQRLEDVIEGLEAAWEFFGGVAARVVLDNLKAAVTKADRYEPRIQRTVEEYAQHRGFVIDPAPVRQPTGKPHVERQVQYVRESFFRGESFRDLDDAQARAKVWCLEVAGRRVHGTTRKPPLEVFEQVEKAALKPLEGERFDTPRWAQVKVHPDHHVRFGNALYSVPTKYLRQPVDVRGDRSLVRIYHRGDLIKTHPTKAAGERSTDYDDYPTDKQAYARRDPDRMVRRARQRGEHLGRFMSRLLSGDFPWSYLRQAQKLMRLADKYGEETVDAACRRALAFDLINVRRVETIVLQGLEQGAGPSPNAPPAQGQLRFLRPNHSFSRPQPQEEPDGD